MDNLQFLALLSTSLVSINLLLKNKFIFHPQTIPLSSRDSQVYQNRIEYRIEECSHSPIGTIIYFGGNAEDTMNTNILRPFIKSFNLTYFNYPGYGKSQGTPSESTVINQAEVFCQMIKTKFNLPIVLFGRSLGCSVAAKMSESIPIKSMVLVSPFYNIRTVMPPLSWLAPFSFQTNEFLKKSKAPTLIIYSMEDEIVPYQSSVRLKEIRKNITLLRTTGSHNEIHIDHALIYKFINEQFG